MEKVQKKCSIESDRRMYDMFTINNASDDVKKLIQNINVFTNYRIVDPDTHNVYDLKHDTLIPAGELCYSIWNRNKPCSNCSSRLCVTKNKHVVKLEYVAEQVFLIASIPIKVHGKSYSLELAQDVSDSLMAQDASLMDKNNIIDVIHNLNDMVIHDFLTGLYNKKYIETEIPRLVNKSISEKRIFTVALIDIDKFKYVNDTYGHAAGDEVIKTIAQYMSEIETSVNDWSARMGGDEFLMIFDGKSAGDVSRLCYQLSQRISSHVFTKDNECFHVDISIGIKQFSAETETAQQLLEQVDKIMYKEKQKKAAKAMM